VGSKRGRKKLDHVCLGKRKRSEIDDDASSLYSEYQKNTTEGAGYRRMFHIEFVGKRLRKRQQKMLEK